MLVLVGFRAFCPASWFVTVVTFAAPQSGTFHTRDCCAAGIVDKTIRYPKFTIFEL